MFKRIQETLSSFHKRDGLYVIGASMLNKLFRFLVQIFVIRTIAKDAWGDLSYAIAVVNFILPFAGFGVNNALLRFGALYDNDTDKKALFAYSLKRGFFIAVMWLCLLWASSGWISGDLPGAQQYLEFLSLYIVTFLLFELLKVYWLLMEQKKYFALADVLYSVLMLLLGLLVSSPYGAMGFVWVIVIVPLLVFLYFIFSPKPGILSSLKYQLKELPKGFYKYGIYVGLGAVASQLMYSVDLILIGELIKDPIPLSVYRTASIIPINLMFVPVAYFTSDNTLIAAKYKDKSFLIQYIKGFMPLFVILSLILSVSLYFFADILIVQIFGDKYLESVPIFRVMLWAVIGAYLLRVPFGNMLSSVGKSSLNAMNAFFLLLLNIGLNYYFISVYGAMGAAYATSISIWASGLLTAACFFYYLHSLKSE